MEEFEYIPKGVCSRKLMFKIEDNKIVDFDVIGGCPGNLQGIRKNWQSGLKIFCKNLKKVLAIKNNIYYNYIVIINKILWPTFLHSLHK